MNNYNDDYYSQNIIIPNLMMFYTIHICYIQILLQYLYDSIYSTVEDVQAFFVVCGGCLNLGSFSNFIREGKKVIFFFPTIGVR